MSVPAMENLSKRERQIMDIIYQREKATVSEVLETISDPPSYSAIRALMRILEEKGYLVHEKEGMKYIYKPAVAAQKAMTNAVQRLLNTFFNNSVEEAVSALIDIDKKSLKDDDYNKLLTMIQEAKNRKGN